MIVIVDYRMGNVGSIANMCKKIGVPAVISSRPEDIERAERLILPGVGAFDEGMQNLHASGLLPLLQRRVVEEGTPVLGICLGMQLMTRSSEEGSAAGLGWVPAKTVRFRAPENPSLKVPHMGWNHARVIRANSLFDGLEEDARFYFVHSYHVVCDDPAEVLATTSYGVEFPSAFGAGNVFGVQFHPEKSHRFGMRLLSNFARMAIQRVSAAEYAAT